MLAAPHPEPPQHRRGTVATCLPADAPTKGGSEATVRVARADLVPTEANLLPAYRDWAALEDACAALCDEVVIVDHGRVAGNGSPEALQQRFGGATLEETFVRVLGGEEGLA